MIRTRSIVAAITLSALTVMVGAGAMSASAAKSYPANGSAHSIVGSWDVTITLVSPPPGVPPVQRSFATFNKDGGTVETANVPGGLRGSSHGAWERIRPNLFAVTRVFFRFNPQTGAYLGTQKVNATARVAANGETFSAVSVSELRDPDGNLVLGGLRATAVGRKIHVERIPDQP
jgi:hypothetical protein